jgi:hypothetical protein
LNLVEQIIDFFKRCWTRCKLHARQAHLNELLVNLQLDQQALDTMGHHEDADALVPLIVQTTRALRAVDSQLRAIGA